MARVEDLKRLVTASPQFRGKRVTILRFGDRETIGTIDRRAERDKVHDVERTIEEVERRH